MSGNRRRKPKKPKYKKPNARNKKPPRPRWRPEELAELPEGGVAPSAGAHMSAGQDARIAEERVRTAVEAGRLRGGSSGVVLTGESGEYSGTCIRAAAARFLGAEPPRRREEWKATRLMFDGGHMSEDYFVTDLQAGLPEGLRLLREEEFPIVSSVLGLSLTCREDVVVVREADPTQVELLVELKNVSSLPVDLLFEESPKLDNLIQIGNYTRIMSEKLGREVPGQLWYTSRTKHSIPTQWKWVQEAMPKWGVESPGSESVEWSRPMYGKPPLPTKIRPFYIGFHVKWHAGRLYYSRASNADATHIPEMWQPTPIYETGIVEYYERVARLGMDSEAAGELPPPPTALESNGKRKGFRACDYCDWSAICSSVGDDTRQWRDAVLSQVEPVGPIPGPPPGSPNSKGDSK